MRTASKLLSRVCSLLRPAMLACILAVSGAAHASCEGIVIHKSSDMAIHLSPMGTALIGSQITAYRALNQNLILEICIANLLSTPQRLSVKACPDGRCEDAEDLEVRHIVSWFRDSNAFRSVFPTRKKRQILVPELLLNDPSLVHNNPDAGISSIRTSTKSGQRYITSREYESIQPSDRHGRLHHDPELLKVEDANHLQPVNVETTARLILRQKIAEPLNSILIEIESSKGHHRTRIPVTNIPTELSESSITNGIYYRSIIDKNLTTLSSEFKSADQVRAELTDIKSKGILYPTAYIYDNYRRHMEIRNAIGFPKDRIFVVDGTLIEHRKKADWKSYEKRMRKIVSDELFSKYDKVFFYLADEPDARTYQYLIEKAAPIARRVGAGLFLAGHANNILNPVVADVVYIVAYNPDPNLSRRVHENGAEIFSYANPQIGIYKPDDLRLNYGIRILTAGYDGIMPYAYQHSSGSQWSDQDGEYREHMLAYPISNGVVGTVHGIALENAIIDQRYLTTYLNMQRNASIGSGCASDQPAPLDPMRLDSKKVDDYRARLAMAITNCLNKQAREAS